MTDCSKCYFSMQNCHDMSICCESEEYYGERCDWFEPIEGDKDDIGAKDSQPVCEAYIARRQNI